MGWSVRVKRMVNGRRMKVERRSIGTTNIMSVQKENDRMTHRCQSVHAAYAYQLREEVRHEHGEGERRRPVIFRRREALHTLLDVGDEEQEEREGEEVLQKSSVNYPTRAC